MKIADCYSRYRKCLLTLPVILPLLTMLILSTPVLAAPTITLSPSSGAIGTEVMITGTNFESYIGDSVSITFDDVEITGSPWTIESGTFSIPFTIPVGTEAGRHWIEATIEIGTNTASFKNFFIIEDAEITLDVFDGPVGTDVVVSGGGYFSGLTVTIYYYNVIGEKVGTVVASPTGTFDYSFAIPASMAGVHKITAENAGGNLAETEFEVIPSITLNLSSGSPGSLLTVSGTGFGHRSQVSIYFDIFAVASAKTNELGTFTVNFNIPEVNKATYDIKAQDELGNLDKTQFTTTAGASLNQSTGPIGSRLTIRGTGFKAGETVTIDYDNLRVATAPADNNGTFSASFDVPLSSSGEHIITVSDGTTAKKFAFNVESEAPPIPDLLLPSASSKTKAAAYLDWQDVTDASMPVIYYLQIASDENFSIVILEKDGLADSEYALTENERLTATSTSTSYFWRVKATDSAGNESGWSASSAFYVSAPPTPEILQLGPDGTFEETVFLNWQDVTSLSPPINYTLQIASGLNFTTIVLEKLALVDSEYYISEMAELELFTKEASYYWRVKATDSANNESEWSTPASFSINPSFTWPGWATYLLIGIGVVIIVYLAFRFGRRTAYQPPE